MESGLFITALGLGLAYAALPGAVNAEVLRRGVAGGFRHALLVHIGAVSGAVFWSVVALTGASLLVRFDAVTIALGLAGAAFLSYLTIVAIKGALPNATIVMTEPKSGNDLKAGIALGVANPAGLPFWTGLASSIVGDDESISGSRAVIFVGGVVIGSLIWGVMISALIAKGRHYLSNGFYRAVNACCAIAFGYFAIRMFTMSLRELI